MPRSSRISRAVLPLLFIATTASAGFTLNTSRQAANDTNPDTEPAVLSQVRGTSEYQTTVYIQRASTTSDLQRLAFSTYDGSQSYSGLLSLPSGYTWAFDPALAQNTSTQDIYCVGIIWGSTPGYDLAVWTSTNGGVSWGSPTVLDSGTAGYDKPWIAVSSATGSVGTIYLTATRMNGNGTEEPVVYAKRTTDAGYAGPFTVTTAVDGLQNPQIMVGPAGNVFVIWTNYATSATLHLARTGAYSGSTPTFTELTPSLSLGSIHGFNTYLTLGSVSNVRAVTIPMAKLSPGTARVGVAWHEPNGSGGSRIHFACTRVYPLSTATDWKHDTFSTVGGSSAYDINVGIEADSSANFVVSWYSFGASSSVYSQYASYVTFSGDQPSHETPVQFTTQTGDVQYLSPDSNGKRHLGEYHDVSLSNGTFKVVGIQATGTNAVNPWIWTIQHY